MAGVGLLYDDVLAVCCQGFVGSDTSKASVNFCITRFDRGCIGATCPELADILVGSSWFHVACCFASFSGLTDIIFSQLNCWCDGSTEEAGEFRVIILLARGRREVLQILF
jgi:hypothetical protein